MAILPVLDFETTLPEPSEALPVSVSFSLTTPRGDTLPGGLNTIINISEWGEVPEEAAAIHGITTARCRTEGGDPYLVFSELAYKIKAVLTLGWPLVIYNAPYDWQVFMYTLDRLGIHEIGEALRDNILILDPLVIDRGLNKRYKSGAHKLENACAHYGIKLENAHDAEADCMATSLLLRALVKKYPKFFGEMDYIELFKKQRNMNEVFKKDLAKYFREKVHKPEVSAKILAEPVWPGIPLSTDVY